MSYRLEFDGASRGNPGIAGAGACLVAIGDRAEEVWFGFQFLGEQKTCNEAEYFGLILGLEECTKRDGLENLIICGDSELIIRQMTGQYQVKDEKLKPLHCQANNLIKSLHHSPSFLHIPREKNRRADHLANIAIENRRSGEEGMEGESGYSDVASSEEHNPFYYPSQVSICKGYIEGVAVVASDDLGAATAESRHFVDRHFVSCLPSGAQRLESLMPPHPPCSLLICKDDNLTVLGMLSTPVTVRFKMHRQSDAERDEWYAVELNEVLVVENLCVPLHISTQRLNDAMKANGQDSSPIYDTVVDQRSALKKAQFPERYHSHSYWSSNVVCIGVFPGMEQEAAFLKRKRDRADHCFVVTSDACSTCGREGALKKCSRCRETCYCSKECQLEDWKSHKHDCGRFFSISRSEDATTILPDAPLVVVQPPYDFDMMGKADVKSSENPPCRVCGDPLWCDKESYHPGGVASLACGHKFHSRCLDKHKKNPANLLPPSNPMNPFNLACPWCRFSCSLWTVAYGR